MKIGFFCCWANMKIYSIYSSSLRKALSQIAGENAVAVTSHCMCFKQDNPAEPEYEFIDLRYFVKTIPSKNRVKYFIKRRAYPLVEYWRGRQAVSRYPHLDVIDFQQSSYAFGYESFKSFVSTKSPSKKVVTIHKLDQSQKDRPELNRVYNKADAVIVFSRYMKDYLVSHGVDADKIHLIYPGTSLPPLRDYPKQQVIMFCGSPIPQVKGYEDLVAALQMLRQERIELRVKIYGFFLAEEKEYAIDLARRHGVDDLIEWQSFKNEDELAEEHQKSLFSLIPYRSYAGYFPAAYSMGNALPIIATDAMGHSEYMKSAGLLISPGRPDQLAKAIKRLLADEALRRELGAEARQRAEQDLSWETVASQTLAVFNTIVRAK